VKAFLFLSCRAKENRKLRQQLFREMIKTFAAFISKDASKFSKLKNHRQTNLSRASVDIRNRNKKQLKAIM
jgi:CHAD domain-containing protein